MRQRLVTAFNADPKSFIFVCSTRSGGIGINLTSANNIIFYDTDWNPAMDKQAQDRCHRIGQLKQVNIYRLLQENTIEENVCRVMQARARIGAEIIDDGLFD